MRRLYRAITSGSFQLPKSWSCTSSIERHLIEASCTTVLAWNVCNGPNYCYQVMPFGLKSARAIYQRLMDKDFANQIGKNLEVYIDDMVVKSISLEHHIQDLEEIFTQVRKYNMRLNPNKCVFGVQGGKFLGFMLTHRRIEANLDKCKAIIKTRKRCKGWLFELRGAIKSQALVDFIVEMVLVVEEDPWWTLYVDDSSCLKRGGASVILEGPRAVSSSPGDLALAQKAKRWHKNLGSILACQMAAKQTSFDDDYLKAIHIALSSHSLLTSNNYYLLGRGGELHHQIWVHLAWELSRFSYDLFLVKLESRNNPTETETESSWPIQLRPDASQPTEGV
ncbi:Retrovirus-related Pol polyprotein from transposon 17.6, partial [Mucuna pruriens]